MQAVRAPGAQPESEHDQSLSPLHDRWLRLAQVGCIAIVLAIVALWLVSIAPRYRQLHALDRSFVDDPDLVRANLAGLGLSIGFYAGYFLAFEILCTLGFLGVAAVLLWRRANEGAALLVALFLVALGVGYPGTLNGLVALHPTFNLVTRSMDNLGWLLFGYVCYLFPDGRFVPRWTRWLAIIWAAILIPDALFPGSLFDGDNWPPLIFLLNFLAIAATWVFAQVYRYRRVSNATQRQQTKWVALGMMAALGVFIVLILSTLVFPSLGQQGSLYDFLSLTGTICCMLLIPLALLLAVLRYRLYDIDLLINRALIYGTLSATLVAVYVGAITTLGYASRALTGGAEQSQLAIVASTLAIAALFQPLRRRIQATIDRRFYRRKYDAARTLATFSATLRDETELERLRADLLVTVEEAMQPAHVSLWLRGMARHE
jgi:hypothetical protein